MTTIILVHPTDRRARFQVFAIYDGPGVHHAFAVEEFAAREEAERVAREMMVEYEADHFRRVVEVGERIG